MLWDICISEYLHKDSNLEVSSNRGGLNIFSVSWHITHISMAISANLGRDTDHHLEKLVCDHPLLVAPSHWTRKRQVRASSYFKFPGRNIAGPPELSCFCASCVRFGYTMSCVRSWCTGYVHGSWNPENVHKLRTYQWGWSVFSFSHLSFSFLPLSLSFFLSVKFCLQRLGICLQKTYEKRQIKIAALFPAPSPWGCGPPWVGAKCLAAVVLDNHNRAHSPQFLVAIGFQPLDFIDTGPAVIDWE